MQVRRLPGGDLVAQGLRDLAAGRVTTPSLLVSVGHPKLEALGFELSGHIEDPEHRLYEQLAAQYGDGAHSKYNALVRRLVSFERAACVN